MEKSRIQIRCSHYTSTENNTVSWSLNCPRLAPTSPQHSFTHHVSVLSFVAHPFWHSAECSYELMQSVTVWHELAESQQPRILRLGIGEQIEEVLSAQGRGDAGSCQRKDVRNRDLRTG